MSAFRPKKRSVCVCVSVQWHLERDCYLLIEAAYVRVTSMWYVSTKLVRIATPSEADAVICGSPLLSICGLVDKL